MGDSVFTTPAIATQAVGNDDDATFDNVQLVKGADL
jgi:hypothetical protein